MNAKQDPEIAQIREVRLRISEECNHDPDIMARHYQDLQKRHLDRLVSAPMTTDKEKTARTLAGKEQS